MITERNQLTEETFEWRMHEGRLIKPANMRTTHLFYSVRMVFNALVPPEHRIEGKIWQLDNRTPPGYWRVAVHIMLKELARRKDLSLLFQAQLLQMADVVKKLATLQIER